MNIANESRIFDDKRCNLGSSADSYQFRIGSRPSADFALCRDKYGKPTAIYGQDKWDYNPYRLSGKNMSKFRFDLLLEGKFKVERRALVDEAKYLLFCIQYFAQAGHTGTIAVSTLYGYYQVMQAAVEFCISLNSNQFIGIISLNELFSKKSFIESFLTSRKGTSFKKRTCAISKHLSYIGQDKVGFIAIADLDINVENSRQTPIIPTRIYLSLISHLTEDVEKFNGKLDRLPDFLNEFSDRFYGRCHELQKGKGVGGKAKWRPNMKQALSSYGLENVFTDEFEVNNVRELSSVLRAIQYIMRLVLYLYTGMRDQEVLRLPFNCIDERNISEEFKDDGGNIIVEKRVIKLISTTTKFTGYRQSASWFAAPEVEQAIKILQLICQGLARLYDANVEESDLFLNPTVVLKPENEISLSTFQTGLRKPVWMKTLIISDKDFAELQQSDDTRDFSETREFHVGSAWPVRSHQFRRSLAFFAASSGFVKLPTLKRQFKHLTLSMTRYYSRNFENVQTIFGCYNEVTKEFDLPRDHIINDCQSSVTTKIVDMMMYDLLGSTDKLYGKTGGYVDRQRERLRDNKVLIENVRADTNKRVEKGELYYRDTLLGGCLKIGKCDSFVLGAITECLTCNEASIKGEKVDIQIKHLKEQLTYFEEIDGEYQVLLAELNKLVNYKQQKMVHKEV